MKGNRGSDNSLLTEKGIKFTHANGTTAYAEPGTKMAAALRKQGYFPGSVASGESREKTIEELEAEDYASGMEDVPSEVQSTKDWIRKDSTIRVPTQKGKNIIFTNANGSYAFAEPGTDEADALMAQQYFPGSIAAKNAGKKFQPAPQNKNGMMTGGFPIYGKNKEEDAPSDSPWADNRLGYHKEEGQNWWDQDSTDPYWDTHVMGTGNYDKESDLKEEVQEIDWSYWKNLLKGG